MSKEKVTRRNQKKESIIRTYSEEAKKFEMDPLKFSQNHDLLRFEYQQAQRMLIHYDNLNWQIGFQRNSTIPNN